MSFDPVNAAIALIGVIIGALGLAPALRKLQKPRTTILVGFQGPQSLLPRMNQDQKHPLVMRIDNEELINPHVLTINISIIGPEDISSRNFDEGRPIRFEIGPKAFLTEVEPSTLKVIMVGSQLLIGPDVLTIRKNYRITVVLEGDAIPSLPISYIPGTVVVDMEIERATIQKLDRRWRGASMAVSGAFLVGAIFVGAHFTNGYREKANPWIVSLVIIAYLAIPGFVNLWLYRYRRKRGF